MASGDNQATFESWLNQATDPNNQEERWDCIQAFYQLVDQEHDGPQVAIRLLAHKIQSPQEKEALQALTVLEACMNNCGKKFHSEAAKFRFLNELIKLLTPKYFGAWTPQTVKDRVTEVLYGWTLWLKEEPKIQEAYSMLKKQGIVKKDPKLPDKVIMPPPTQRTTDSVFDQEDKATLLARLLKSARPEDLETANRLIKSTIKEEQEKAEKASKRESTLKEVESSTKELRELLERQVVTESQDGKVLYERCERLRPSLFRLASDTMDDDAALAQILAANDELTLVVNAYKDRAGKKECNGGRERRRSEEETEAPKSPREIKSYHLIDLSALDSPPTHRKSESPPPSSPSSLPLLSSLSSLPSSSSPTSSSLLESDPHAPAEQHLNESDHRVSKWTSRSYYDELLQQLNGEIHVENGGSDVSLRARGCSPSNGSDFWSSSQTFPPVSPSKLVSETCGGSGKVDELLKKIFVPVETIRPSNLEPITVYDQGGVHVSLHFAKDCPPGQPGVAVAVVSTVNTSALAVKDYLLQAAVPKTVMLKLQPASGTELPPYNPLLPPPAISQVLLLANPHRRKLRLRYKLALTHGDRRLDEGGEIDNFPDWTSLTTRWNQLNSGTQQ